MYLNLYYKELQPLLPYIWLMDMLVLFQPWVVPAGFITTSINEPCLSIHTQSNFFICYVILWWNKKDNISLLNVMESQSWYFAHSTFDDLISSTSYILLLQIKRHKAEFMNAYWSAALFSLLEETVDRFYRRHQPGAMRVLRGKKGFRKVGTSTNDTIWGPFLAANEENETFSFNFCLRESV